MLHAFFFKFENSKPKSVELVLEHLDSFLQSLDLHPEPHALFFLLKEFLISGHFKRENLLLDLGLDAFHSHFEV